MPDNQFDYKHINLDYLHDFSGGDDEFVIDMVQTFLLNAPANMTELRILKSDRKWSKLKRFAYKSKSSFQLMGIEELSRDSAILEKLCDKKGTENDIENLLAFMESVFADVLKELNHVLEQKIEKLSSAK